ncbi:MAG: outer membrane protein assembly factor BamB [Oceanicoccus sp.]|jgi:outer membrane protein assembly factor BamB
MRLLFVLLLVSLAACSSNDKKEQKEVGPKALQGIDEEIQLSQQWRHQVGNGMGKAYARLQPVIDGGFIYVASANGLVEALSLKDGNLKWAQNFDAEITAAIAVYDGKGYIATANGDIIALSIAEGKEIWRKNIKSEVLSVPVIDGNDIAIQTVDGKLHVIDAENGKPRWSYDSNLPNLSLRGTSQPIFHGGSVIAGFASGKVVGLNTENGMVLWQERIGIPAGRSELERLVDVDGRLLIKDDTLFVAGYQGHVMAIDLRNGKAMWKREASSYHGPLNGLGNIYLVSADDHILALDDQSTNEVWVQADLEARQLSEAVLFANHIAVTDFEGYIHLIKQLDGTIVGRDQLVRPPVSWVRTGSYGIKHPSRQFDYDDGIRTRLLAEGDYLVAISNSGYLSVFKLDK